MRLVSFLLVAATCGAGLALGGCRFGEARFESDFDGALNPGFDPGGTVFSYLDSRSVGLVEDVDPRVVVVMTWIVFDPSSDLNDLDGASLSAMSHEMAVRDTLVLVFDHQGAVDDGEKFASTRDGVFDAGGSLDVDDVDDSDGFEARLHLAPERLTSTSTFQDLHPFASRQQSEVEIDVASFDEANPVVAGVVAVEFAAVAGRDVGDAREGRIEGTFRAPLVDERIAESNLALLDDDGLLGLPLPDRQARE